MRRAMLPMLARLQPERGRRRQCRCTVRSTAGSPIRQPPTDSRITTTSSSSRKITFHAATSVSVIPTGRSSRYVRLWRRPEVASRRRRIASCALRRPRCGRMLRLTALLPVATARRGTRPPTRTSPANVSYFLLTHFANLNRKSFPILVLPSVGSRCTSCSQPADDFKPSTRR